MNKEQCTLQINDVGRRPREVGDKEINHRMEYSKLCALLKKPGERPGKAAIFM